MANAKRSAKAKAPAAKKPAETRGNVAPPGTVPYTGRVDGNLHGLTLPSGGVALVADVQYADASRRHDDKLNDRPEDGRMYSLTLDTFTRSARYARETGAGSLVLLGDQVDDRDRQGDAAAIQVLEAADRAFSGCPIGYLLGNHDTKWSQTFRQAREKSPVAGLQDCFAWECTIETEDGSPPWVLLALDCYAMPQVGWGEQMLPVHGEVGRHQREWLQRRLAAARDSGQNAIVCSHSPLHPANSLHRPEPKHRSSASPGHTLCVLDSEGVLDILREAGSARLCLAGHDHRGAHHCDENDIHYVTLPACLSVVDPAALSGAVLRVFRDHATLTMLCDGSTHDIPYPVSARAAESVLTQELQPQSPPSPDEATPARQEGQLRQRRWGRQREQGAMEKPTADDDTETCQSSASRSVCAATPMPVAAPRSRTRAPYIFDMETGDPDDVLTLLFLCAHPAVDLRAVTITPGSEEQLSLVRWILNEVGATKVRLGAQDWPANAAKPGCMTGRFYDNFGRLKGGAPCERADALLLDCCDEAATLVTGAALHNLGAALQLKGFRLGRWVAQGGFAGEGVVPVHLQMEKFAGKVTCPTWNFNGNPAAATAALASPHIDHRIFVSKNVCHRAVYDKQWHDALGAAVEDAQATADLSTHGRARLASLSLMHRAMDAYLSKRGEKKMHDPLALAVALDESVCKLAEVELFRANGGWGSRLVPGSGKWISIDYDPIKFRAALLDG